MSGFLLIFKHYFKRCVEPIGILILAALPVTIIVILTMVMGNTLESQPIWNGYNIMATQIAILMMVMFQFFGGNVALDYFHSDFRGDMRWRLLASPRSVIPFISAVTLTSWIFSILSGLLVIIVTAVFLDAYWGNPVILILTLITLAAFAQLLYMLLFLVCKKKGTAEGIAQVVIWGMAFSSGWFTSMSEDAGAMERFVMEYATPLGLARRAIEHSGTAFADLPSEYVLGGNMGGAIMNLLILIGMTVLLGAAVMLIGRRRKF